MAYNRFDKDSVAVMFPGQSSQEPGMGEYAYHKSDEAKEIFDIGSIIMETDLAEICFGSETDKLSTSLVQPAIVAAEMANYRLMRRQGLNPQLMMGHSLGEIAALGAAEAVSVRDIFKVTKVRAEVTDRSSVTNPGIMAAVLGLTKEQLGPVLARANDRLHKLGETSAAYAANHNWRKEQVLSGHPDAVERVRRIVKRLEGLKIVERAGVVKLRVPGAFHSPYNQSGVEEYKAAFEEVKRKTPNVMLLNNLGQYMINPDRYPDYYSQQLVNGVEWDLMMHRAASDGIRKFTEVKLSTEPKKAVLSNFVKSEFEGHYEEDEASFGEVITVNWTPELSEYMRAELEAV